MRKVAVLDHPMKPETKPVANDIVTFLNERKIAVHRATSFESDMMTAFMPGIDLVISLGGDGSILRAGRVAAPHGVPVAGVHMGRLGFLSEMTPDNWRELLPKYLEGAFWTEERTMLTATVSRGAEVLGRHDAINDVVVGRRTLARIVRVKVSVDDTPLTTYACDGLIVSTATGSTAYALAAGGPILAPTLRNMLMVPIAPHLSLDRAMLFDPDTRIELAVSTDSEATMTADGQNEIVLHTGDRVVIETHPNVARFARVRPKNYFYQSLVGRLLRPEAVGS
jgi:NAD+ kinase